MPSPPIQVPPCSHLGALTPQSPHPSSPELVFSMWLRRLKPTLGADGLVSGSPPLCQTLEEAVPVSTVGRRSPAESPSGAKQVQDKQAHSTPRNRPNVVLKKLRLASFGEGPGLAPFNSQILVGCCNYL